MPVLVVTPRPSSRWVNAEGLASKVCFTASAEPMLELTSNTLSRSISPWPPSLWLLSRMRLPWKWISPSRVSTESVGSMPSSMQANRVASLKVEPGSTAVPMAWLKSSQYSTVPFVDSWRVRLEMAWMCPVWTSHTMTVPHAASCLRSCRSSALVATSWRCRFRVVTTSKPSTGSTR